MSVFSTITSWFSKSSSASESEMDQRLFGPGRIPKGSCGPPLSSLSPADQDTFVAQYHHLNKLFLSSNDVNPDLFRTPISTIVPGDIYLCGYPGARNKELIAQLGIRRVLNVAPDESQTGPQFYQDLGIIYKEIGFADFEDESIGEYVIMASLPNASPRLAVD
jgi:hypothetical protein